MEIVEEEVFFKWKEEVYEYPGICNNVITDVIM